MTAGTPEERPVAVPVSIGRIFWAFLVIGGTSFGGGVVAYLRTGMVTRRGWLDDPQFVELLSISQTIPGLNATNLAILIGDRLRGLPGACAALAGMCLPGGAFMYLAAILYGAQGDRPLAGAALKGVSAAAVGLILATVMQVGRKALAHNYDLVFVALTVIGVNRLHQPVPRVLLVVGLVAVLWYRPGTRAVRGAPEPDADA
jgi:chromate transporter